MEFDFVLLFLDTIFLQEDGGIFGFMQDARDGLGSHDPIIQGIIPSLFAVAGIGILLNLFNAGVRKKMVDQVKLKRIMKETRSWQKERMAAMRSKDQAKTDQLNKK